MRKYSRQGLVQPQDPAIDRLVTVPGCLRRGSVARLLVVRLAGLLGCHRDRSYPVKSAVLAGLSSFGLKNRSTMAYGRRLEYGLGVDMGGFWVLNRGMRSGSESNLSPSEVGRVSLVCRASQPEGDISEDER